MMLDALSSLSIFPWLEIEVSKKRKRKKTAKTCSSDQFNANGHSSTCDSDLIDDAEWRGKICVSIITV